MTAEAAMRNRVSLVPFATLNHVEIAGGIAQMEAELALVASPCAASADAEVQSRELLDQSDKEWRSNTSVGPCPLVS